MSNVTVCPRSSDPSYIVSYYIKWVTTSWTYSIILTFFMIIKNVEAKITYRGASPCSKTRAGGVGLNTIYCTYVYWD